MLGISEHLSEEDEAAFEALRDADDKQQADDGATAQASQGEDTPPATDGGGAQGQDDATSATTDGDAAKSGADQAQASNKAGGDGSQAKPGGDLRAALRASRRAEHKARQDAARWQARVQELEGSAGQSNAADEIEAAMHEIDEDAPSVAKVVKAMQSKIDQLDARTVGAGQAQAESVQFEPLVFPPEVQEHIDSVPDLLAWQHDPDQTKFGMAQAEDNKLRLHPHWKDRPLEERFAEAARRVAREFQAPDTPERKQAVSAAQRVAEAARSAPASISDIGGGGGRQTQGTQLSRFMDMSDDDIFAELSRDG